MILRGIVGRISDCEDLQLLISVEMDKQGDNIAS